MKLRAILRPRFRHTTMLTQRTSGLKVEPLECRRVLTTFFVDGAADPGGDGSEASPFDTIQAAVDAAADADGADEISLAPGVYVENVDAEEVGDLTILGNGSTVTAADPDERTIDIDESGDIAVHQSEDHGVRQRWTSSAGQWILDPEPRQSDRQWR